MNYYLYSSQIRDLMKKAKANNTVQLLNINQGTIYVKYNSQLDDYMFQYSWIMDNENTHLDEEVVKTINSFRTVKYTEKEVFENMDVIQVGLMTMFDLDYDDFSGMIVHAKNNLPLNELRDTNYIFCGNKLLRIVQNMNCVRNPLEHLNRITKWNDISLEDTLDKKVMGVITKGIKYNHSELGTILFCLGYEDRKTVFSENANIDFPHYICIDDFMGTIVNGLENTIN